MVSKILDGIQIDQRETRAVFSTYAAKYCRRTRTFNLFLLLCLASLATLFTFLLSPIQSTLNANISLHSNEWPADDTTYPIRAQTSWDISTDFPYPRTLSYDVTEGTWLRLDVHPINGDIIFDMVGDLYCLPARAYTNLYLQSDATERAEALPVVTGIPYDTDPHFSPRGDRFVWRSDAGLGLENIWVQEWDAEGGCTTMSLSGKGRSKFVGDPKVTEIGKKKRLMDEGRWGARRVTNETYRWVSDARFHPSGTKVIANKWYTSQRSLGAGEGWEYNIPSLSSGSLHNQEDETISAGSGRRAVGRTLPSGWGIDKYGDQQIGGEQFIWRGNDSVIYAMNVKDVGNGVFEYSKDVHRGIYAILSRNLTANHTEILVDAFPGGASRPELSRDGRTLAFVRRVRDKEALVLKDIITGTIHHVWHGLTYDLTAISAPMGTYPSFAFTPSDDAVIIWASGQIYHVPLALNAQGEKVALPNTPPQSIPFRARIEKRLAETRSIHPGKEFDFVGLETGGKERIRAFRGLQVDSDGGKAVFEGAGVTYVQNIGDKDKPVQSVPVQHSDTPYYAPSFVHGSHGNLVLHARWDDRNFTSFELADVHKGVAYALVGIPVGRYVSPILCSCKGRKRQIAFVKTGGDLLTGNIVATAGVGLYIGDIVLPDVASEGILEIEVKNLQFVQSEIVTRELVLKMQFLEGNKRLLVQQSDRAFVINIAGGADKFGTYKHQIVAKGKTSSELVVVPSAVGKSGRYAAEYVAFVDFFHVYLAPGSSVRKGENVWSKPGYSTKGLVRLSLDGGHNVVWGEDGKRVFWFLGPYLHSLEVSKLRKCESSIKKDPLTYGISCVKDLLSLQEIIVEHSTDTARLTHDARVIACMDGRNADNADVLVIFNATILTMEHGSVGTDLIENGVLVTRSGVIESVRSVGRSESLTDFLLSGATAINARGGFVVPGFIDVHAHWGGFETNIPANSWEMETFLAYGVTTLHNPSADNVYGFIERSRVERGHMIGPRIFTVGDIIYGAGARGIHQDIVDSDEAYSALVRIKAEGGPASISYKNYNLPSRASRQRLLLAARNLSMLCVPEGGMNIDWDMTYIIDGMTTVEHALPVPELYDDVLTLYALSGTGATPTHVVNYGGAAGEQLVWSTYDIPNDPKLRRFTRHDILEGLTETTSRPANSYALFNTSTSVAKMVQKGLLAHIGAHGEPPLGLNYHAEMYFTQTGGLNNYEVLRAATMSAAITLGMRTSLGSLSKGKLADFLVYPPGVDLLGGDISETKALQYVVRGGRVWDAANMEEVWPVKGKKQMLPPINAE